MKYFLSSFLSLFFFIPLFAQINLDSGLVAYYPFNGTANDVSGNGNNPVFNNATLTSDISGNPNSAYYFNGINNFMQIPNSASLGPQEITLYAIVKPMGFYNGLCYNTCIIDKGSPDGIPGFYSLRYTQSAFTNANCNNPDTLHQNFVGYSYANPNAPLYTPYVTYNTSYCLAYTVSFDTLALYVDGLVKWKVKKPSSTQIGFNSEDVFFGAKNSAQYPYWFKGVVDEVRIYNRAINEQEINVLCARVLPIKLKSLNLQSIGCRTTSTWEIGSEINASHYEIERSENAYKFYQIGRVNASNENTISKSYSFEDNNPIVGTSYYRIKMVSGDGKSEYSPVKEVKSDCLVKHKVIIYPTIGRGFVNVKLTPGFSGAIVKVINLLGEEVASDATKSLFRYIDLSKMPGGLYLVQVINNNKIIENVKVLVTRK